MSPTSPVLKYFHFNEHPFKIGPDPRFLYMSSQVKNAIANCEFKIYDRVGPLYMFGPIGSGKTTLIRRLYENLSSDEQFQVQMVIAPNLTTSNAFLRNILDSFDVKTERSYLGTLKNFERYLIEQYNKEIIPVLLVDEAQNMTRDTLKLMHYLLNFETKDQKLLQIVLVGQEELGAKILKFRELASRMFPIVINAMNIEDLREMLTFRLMVAGSQEPLFTNEAEAMKILHSYTKGLPRDAVRVCDELLRYLVVSQKKQATPQEVEQIAVELLLSKPEPETV